MLGSLFVCFFLSEGALLDWKLNYSIIFHNSYILIKRSFAPINIFLILNNVKYRSFANKLLKLNTMLKAWTL